MSLQIWLDAKSSRMSAAMTYYTMLSLAPLLMIAIAVATQVYCSEQVKAEIMQYAREVASPQVAQTIGSLLENTTAPQSGLIAGTISLIILLYGASGIFSQLLDTFNEIWQVPPRLRSGLRFSIRNRLVGVVMVLMVGGLLIGTLALSSVLTYFSQMLDGSYPRLTSWLSLADRGLSFILLPFVLSLMFWYFPARRMKWMDVWPAAGLTAFMLSASRYLIDIYLRISTSSEVYGAAGSLVMLLVWVYLTGLILFFGAAFSYAWTKTFGSHSKIEHEEETIDQSLLKGLSVNLGPQFAREGLEQLRETVSERGASVFRRARLSRLKPRESLEDAPPLQTELNRDHSFTNNPSIGSQQRPLGHDERLPRDILSARDYNPSPVERDNVGDEDRAHVLPLTPNRRSGLNQPMPTVTAWPLPNYVETAAPDSTTRESSAAQTSIPLRRRAA